MWGSLCSSQTTQHAEHRADVLRELVLAEGKFVFSLRACRHWVVPLSCQIQTALSSAFDSHRTRESSELVPSWAREEKVYRSDKGGCCANC